MTHNTPKTEQEPPRATTGQEMASREMSSPRNPVSLTGKTERVAVQATILAYLEGLRDGAEGEFGQYALKQAFPKGLQAYPPIEHLRGAQRLEGWLADPESQLRRTFDALHGRPHVVTPEQLAKDRRDLFGG